MKPLRFFYLPNEIELGDQVGPRKAFQLLLQQGVFSALACHSFLVERGRHARHADALDALLRAAEAFAPDVIFWQHLNDSYPVTPDFLRRLKGIASAPKLVWHDPDPYGRWVKPIEPVMKVALAHCDLAIVKGTGYLMAEMRRAGSRRVVFAPESVDDERFGQPWVPTRQRAFDAVMVANLTCLKRIPFLFMPGGRQRKATARLFHRAYGARFAVFGAGQGWRGEPYCRGPVAFSDQEAAVRQAWISVNWSQFDDIPMYSSDRLPISLAAGVPHITNHQRGFEHLFPDAKGVYFVHSPAEALDVADMLLGLPRDRLIEIGRQGADYARSQLSASKVYADIVTVIRQQLFVEA
jgi:hypothetical protein